MTSPSETMGWLAIQFRDRANDADELNTEEDARQVEAAKAAFDALLVAVHAILRCARGELELPVTQRQPWPVADFLMKRAIILCEGDAPDLSTSARMAQYYLAAPEMFRALQIAEEQYENFAGGGKDDGTLGVIRQALAKARGDR